MFDNFMPYYHPSNRADNYDVPEVWYQLVVANAFRNCLRQNRFRSVLALTPPWHEHIKSLEQTRSERKISSIIAILRLRFFILAFYKDVLALSRLSVNRP